jgi:ABC-type nickel/cobalt efflux system permease component RcnA
VVGAKGALGAAAALLVAFFADPRRPSPGAALALLVIGAVGYGTSLQLYLRAQRLIGAARTASVFAMAPLAGAVIALLLGAAAPTWPLAVASALVIIGVWLHASEHHGHRHHHEALEHEHVHHHDDGHHEHAHGDAAGPHSHPHRHEALEHEHEHADDLHHLHPH